MTDVNKFKGIFPALLTPFNEKNEINEKALEYGTKDGEITEFIKMIDEEEHALVVGPDGECFCSMFQETKPNQKISFFAHCDWDCCEQLLFLAQEKYIKKEPSLASYEGPFYIRSET